MSKTGENTFEGFPFEEAYDSPAKQHKLWEELAEEYDLTGANIQNILGKSLLTAQVRNHGLITKQYIEEEVFK